MVFQLLPGDSLQWQRAILIGRLVNFSERFHVCTCLLIHLWDTSIWRKVLHEHDNAKNSLNYPKGMKNFWHFRHYPIKDACVYKWSPVALTFYDCSSLLPSKSNLKLRSKYFKSIRHQQDEVPQRHPCPLQGVPKSNDMGKQQKKNAHIRLR